MTPSQEEAELREILEARFFVNLQVPMVFPPKWEKHSPLDKVIKKAVSTLLAWRDKQLEGVTKLYQNANSLKEVYFKNQIELEKQLQEKDAALNKVRKIAEAKVGHGFVELAENVMNENDSLKSELARLKEENGKYRETLQDIERHRA